MGYFITFVFGLVLGAFCMALVAVNKGGDDH